MALFKKTTLTIKNNMAIKLDKPLKFFKNDSLVLYFEVEQYNFEIKQYETVVPLSAIAFIETPEGKDSINTTIVDGDLIMFHLTSKFTKELGTFKIQIVIRDTDGCQCALPYFEFEVQDLINDSQILVDENGDIITSTEDVDDSTINFYDKINELEERIAQLEGRISILENK